MVCRLTLALLVLASASLAAAQTPARVADDDDPSVLAFLQELEATVTTMDRARWTELLSVNADRDQATEFFDATVPQGVTRAVVKERDRASLLGSLPGEGYRLVVEVFIETGPRGRVSTWRLDIRRPRGEDLGPQPWRIVSEERLSSVEGLHRLSLQRERQYSARDLVLHSVDFELKMPAGAVFVAETAEGVTAVVLIGDGMMSFAPQPKEERGQLHIFSGGDSLETPFTTAFVRLSPFEFEQAVASTMLEPSAVDPRVLRRGLSVFDDEVGKSFSLDLSDLSRDTWSLLPQPGDFVAEVRTRRFSTLTYARSTSQPEDVTLFQRDRKRNIASYASEEKLSSRGRFYDEDDLSEIDILDYHVESTFFPDREWLDGNTRLRIRVKTFALAVLTLRLAESLNVSSVYSEEFGRLLFLRVHDQNSIVVNLPTPVPRDFALTITVAYQGRLTQQEMRDESATAAGEQRSSPQDEVLSVPPEPRWLFSNRDYWYPQAGVTDYATATLRIAVPADYAVAGSGAAASGSPTFIPTPAGTPPQLAYVFAAAQPVRYLGIVVSKMSRVDSATVALDIVPTPGAIPKAGTPAPVVPRIGSRNTIELSVVANRRQEQRGRDALGTAADILRLYAAMMGDVPYDALTVAMIEDTLPGGHAPAYFAALNNPPPVTPNTWRNDPANFPNFPEFFLAHELAHQWFGQAVGWKNYHEQWLSEGFAQYFAALFAKERRGEAAFREILRQLRRWGMDDSDQGPVYLGYRLGHIKGNSRVFRALVYNKGASVLHMLRRLLGDDVFMRGLRRFYEERRFQKAGTDDLQKAMEQESGRSLGRFFERWIYDSTLPRVRFSSSVEGQDLVVRFEQAGEVFDLPVTVSITYADGKTAEHIVAVTDAVVEQRLPLTGQVRSVDVNQDGAALAVFEKK